MMMKWLTVSMVALAVVACSCSPKPVPAAKPAPAAVKPAPAAVKPAPAAVKPAPAPAQTPAPVAKPAPAPAPAPAATTTPAAPAASVSPSDMSNAARVRGVIAEVKADTKTVTLTPNGRDASSVIFVITDDTILLPKGTTFQDMKAGVNLRVDYTDNAGKKTAVKIRIDG